MEAPTGIAPPTCCIQCNVSPAEQTCTTPAARGHLTCLRISLSKGFRLNSNATAAAARGGHLECLRLLLLRDCRVSLTAVVEAATHQRLECLKLLCLHQEYPFKFRAEVCSLACHGGSLPCLQYLHGHGYCLSATCHLAAASAGHLACMQYLLSQDCPWDGSVMFAAAQSGKFDCLCFAYENGCPWWDQDADLGTASIHSHQCVLFVVKYCPMPVTSMVSDFTYEILQTTQALRTVVIGCLTKRSLPISLQQIILQHADLLCIASRAVRDETE